MSDCCHKLGHWAMTSSGYDRVTQCHKLGHWGMTSSNYDRSYCLSPQDAAFEWQAVTTIVLLLSQTRKLRNDNSGHDRSHYCCHRCLKFRHWGMTSSGYDRVTACHSQCNKLGHWGMTSSGHDRATACHSSVSEFVTSVNSDCLTFRSEWQAVTTIVVTVVTGVTNSDTEFEWQAVTTTRVTACHKLGHSGMTHQWLRSCYCLSQTRTLRNDKQWLRLCYCCHLGHWGMTSSGYDRVTVVRNSDTEEWQAVTTIVLLLSHSSVTAVYDNSG